jgi:hypothetical protein
MAYTYGNFKEYLKFRMGQRSELETVNTSTNMYGVWVNAAYKDLTTRNVFWGLRLPFDFPELKQDCGGTATSDGVAYISTPSDCLHVFDLWDSTNDVWLNKIGWGRYTGLSGRADTDSENKPTQWVRYGSYIYLYPTPDAEYTVYVYYRSRPTAMTDDDADSLAIGEEWDEAVLELAAHKGHRWLHEYAKADQCKATFLDMVTNLIGIYAREEIGMKRTTKMSARFAAAYKRR